MKADLRELGEAEGLASESAVPDGVERNHSRGFDLQQWDVGPVLSRMRNTSRAGAQVTSLHHTRESMCMSAFYGVRDPLSHSRRFDQACGSVSFIFVNWVTRAGILELAQVSEVT